MLINAKGCGIKSEAGLLRKLSSKVKETQYEEDVGHTGAGHAFGACADAGLVPAALAANSEASVAFKQVPNDTLDTLIRPDLAVGEI